MPYLHCPHCRHTAWLRSESEPALACRHCGMSLEHVVADEDRYLARAVRERFARDMRLTTGIRRFVRE